MSACLMYQTRDKCYICADTAISNENCKRIEGSFEKVYNHNAQLVFCAGLARFSRMVREVIESEDEIDLEKLRKYCLKNYGSEDWYYDIDNKRMICEILIVKRINGVIHSYLLSSYNNFRVEESVIENNDADVIAVGFEKEKLLEAFEKKYNDCVGTRFVNNFTKVEQGYIDKGIINTVSASTKFKIDSNSNVITGLYEYPISNTEIRTIEVISGLPDSMFIIFGEC